MVRGQNGNPEAAILTLTEAAFACPDYCFPNQTEAVVVLQWASTQNPDDSKAPYYLGNYWYNAQNFDEAISCWEKSCQIDDHFPTAHRNLALGYFNKRHDAPKALAELEKAFSLDQTDSRILMELDQLYKRLNEKPDYRLNKLEKHLELVNDRDDLYLEHASLYNVLGQFEKAYKLIMARKFHPWEGGEGKVTGQYVFSLTEMAKKAIEDKEFEKAIDLLNKAKIYPENLGEGKLTGAQENEVFYWMGCANEGLNESGKSVEFWEKAATGLVEPLVAVFYNDQKPETIYYQGLALIKLNQREAAAERFNKLISFGKAHLNDEFKLDYFAVSLPDLLIWEDNLTKRYQLNCRKLISLGELGLSKLPTNN